MGNHKNAGVVDITPTIEFWPEAKVKSDPYEIKIDRKQMGLPIG